MLQFFCLQLLPTFKVQLHFVFLSSGSLGLATLGSPTASHDNATHLTYLMPLWALVLPFQLCFLHVRLSGPALWASAWL